ncbi:adenylate cyclase-associated protein-like protein [Dermatophagoides farinae]|uniref:Adenylate cyclase-associated protein-like protein n=1 Tax=Dermatophagoides farinae TaxID=6954 RepID=A0A9D4SCC7_DERFA|nr:adenylyl cyclase-associated protein 1-like isoform X2 [Dermatophagoides farinae]KAH7637072.1 adenylate cyclase-associated protein-like protein [Dermatophagoides farinae]
MFSNSVAEFQDLLTNPLDKFLAISNEIGGLVKEQCTLVRKALDAQLDFLRLASQSQKPADSKLLELLRPTSDLITQIISIRDKNRKDEHFNLLSSIAEGIAALGWVSVVPTPAPYIKEMSDSAQFYTNKVLIAYKDKNAQIVQWAKLWIEFLGQLQQYVRRNHTTGLVWNAKGNALNGANGPPPPPPPPSADFFNDNSTNSASGNPNDQHAALFASINKGTDITKGLRKVTSEQQTHKNSSLRQSSLVPDRKSDSIGQPTCGKNIRKLCPKLSLEGKKWTVENYFGRRDLVIDDTNMTQSINIYNCNESVLTVKGKVNLITVNECRKFSIIFDNVLSVLEFINCQRVQAQVNGVVPTITIDKTDGIEVYLSNESLQCEIVTSKSSEINISILNASGDYVEHPLPEQFKSVWTGNRFKTEALDG